MLILTDSNSVWSTVLIMLLRSCLRSKEKSFLMSESGMHTEGEVTVCVPYTWCTWYPSRAYRHLRTKWYVVTVAQLCSSSRQDHYIGSFLLLLLTSTHLWLPENWTSQYVYTNITDSKEDETHSTSGTITQISDFMRLCPGVRKKSQVAHWVREGSPWSFWKEKSVNQNMDPRGQVCESVLSF